MSRRGDFHAILSARTVGDIPVPADPAIHASHPLVVALRAALRSHRDAVLQAPPGAGKSTIVPLALLEESWLAGRRILMLEPRRLAARAVAQRMAQTLGERVGETVGYRMRMDSRVGRSTRIEVITEGVLTRMLQSDPALEGVGCVIFDEFHERSLIADLGLALCLDARAQLGAPFRVLVMSATLDGARVATLLDDAPVVNVPGRSFEVDVRHVGRGLPTLPSASESPERSCAQAIRRALDESSGDMLVFLPGAGEIRRVQGLLQDGSLPRDVRVLPLYGELAGEVQDAALTPSAGGARKIVLATNIAETSLTIPGVTVVIDSGLVRRSRFDPVTGMSRLELMRISRASADQRAGRAGRTAPGMCYRLWSEGAHATLAAYTPPEILEADLASLALDLANWGIDDATRLRWMDAPPAPMLSQARELLTRLDALDRHGRINDMGRDMARLPLHPRLAHMMGAARAADAVPLAAELAALLSERDLLRRSDRDPDIRTRLELLRRESRRQGVDDEVLRRITRTAEQLQRLAGEMTARLKASGDRGGGSVGALLAAGFPDRVGQRREGGEGRYLLANGRGARFAGASTLAQSPYIVALELDDKDREARIDLAAPLSREELEHACAAHIETIEDVAWDAKSGSVSAARIRHLDALVLESRPLTNAASERMIAAMLDGVRQLGIEALPWNDDTRTLRERMEFVRRLQRNDLGDWPASDDATLAATLAEWLAPWLEGCTRREHLTRVPLAEALQSRLTHAQRQKLNELAPRDLAVPSGSHIRIDYLDDNAPCIAVRLQEVFGLATTPRIGDGAVPVTFKLLSPAQRPVQITRDLAGFWRSSYVEVRKDMRGRYPRHNWPENPLEAAPSKRSLKRR
jgi:ATP-dependent helicase HrpB